MRGEEMLRMRRGLYDGETVYLKAIPDSLSPSEVPQSPVDGVREKQVYSQGRSRWTIRKCSKGQEVMTIPKCINKDTNGDGFEKESSEVVISGWIDGEIRYLMAIPVRFWTGPKGIAGGLDLPE
jgi:hypothetical protein